jgi:hypothetical protein
MIQEGSTEKNVEIAQKSLQLARIKPRLSRVFSVEVPLAVTSVESSAGQKNSQEDTLNASSKEESSSQEGSSQEACS